MMFCQYGKALLNTFQKYYQLQEGTIVRQLWGEKTNISEISHFWLRVFKVRVCVFYCLLVKL